MFDVQLIQNKKRHNIQRQIKQQKEPIDINKDTNVTAYYLGTAEIFHNFDHFLKIYIILYTYA